MTTRSHESMKHPVGYFRCNRCQALIPTCLKHKHVRLCGHDGKCECPTCHEMYSWGNRKKHVRSHAAVARKGPALKNTIKLIMSAEALAKARQVALAEEGNASWKTCRDVILRIIMKYEPEGKT